MGSFFYDYLMPFSSAWLPGARDFWRSHGFGSDNKWVNDISMIGDTLLNPINTAYNGYLKAKDYQQNTGQNYLDMQYGSDFINSNGLSAMPNSFSGVADALPFSNDVAQIYGSTRKADQQARQRRFQYAMQKNRQWYSKTQFRRNTNWRHNGWH